MALIDARGKKLEKGQKVIFKYDALIPGEVVEVNEVVRLTGPDQQFRSVVVAARFTFNIPPNMPGYPGLVVIEEDVCPNCRKDLKVATP